MEGHPRILMACLIAALCVIASSASSYEASLHQPESSLDKSDSASEKPEALLHQPESSSDKIELALKQLETALQQPGSVYEQPEAPSQQAESSIDKSRSSGQSDADFGQLGDVSPQPASILPHYESSSHQPVSLHQPESSSSLGYPGPSSFQSRSSPYHPGSHSHQELSSSLQPESSSNQPESVLLRRQEAEAVAHWKDSFHRLKVLVGSAVKVVTPLLLSSASSDKLNVSSACRRSLFQLIADVKTMKPWAVHMLDASAKSISGILTGTLASFGSFDQCVNTTGPVSKGSGLPKFLGHYCTVQAWPPMPPKPRYYALNRRLEAFDEFENDTGMLGEMTKHVQLFYILPFRFGVCVPSTCSPDDVTSMATFVVGSFLPYKIEVPECVGKEEEVIEDFQLPIIFVTVVLGCLLVCGTLVDVLYVRKRKPLDLKPEETGTGLKCLVAFSAVTNLEIIMDTVSPSATLHTLHGIRFYSICWIILGHTYFHLNFSIIENLEITIQLLKQMSFNAVTNASLVVENFFFISGLLMMYVSIDMSEKMGKMPSPFYFFIHRLWRLLPIQMLFVGVTTLLPLFGSGPMWHENIDPLVNACRTDWWPNMLFINNLFRSSQTGCVSHSWYLAADFQLYLFCIPIVFLIVKRPKIGLFVNAVVIVGSLGIVGLYNYFRELPPTMLFTHADVEQRTQLMREIYYPPYQHAAAHCIGIWVGYFLHSHKGPLKMHWGMKAAAWTLTFVVTTVTLFGVHTWNSNVGDTGVVPTVIYATFSRVAWTLTLAWMVVACNKGCGGVMTKLLKWKALVPFSRLTYLVYMVHPFVQHAFYASLRGGITAQSQLAVFVCFGFIVVSFGIALMLCLLVEAPFINLGKIIYEVKQAHESHAQAASMTNKRNTDKAKVVNEFQCKISDQVLKNIDSHKEKNLNNAIVNKGAYKNSTFVCHL